MSNRKQVWLVQRSAGAVGDLDFVDLYASPLSAMSKALEEVVRWEERVGPPEETHAWIPEGRAYHRWHWPELCTVTVTETPVQ